MATTDIGENTAVATDSTPDHPSAPPIEGNTLHVATSDVSDNTALAQAIPSAPATTDVTSVIFVDV